MAQNAVLNQVEEDIKLCEEYLSRNQFAAEEPDWAMNRRTYTDFDFADVAAATTVANEANAMFDRLDVNNDGVIDRSEFIRGLSSLGTNEQIEQDEPASREQTPHKQPHSDVNVVPNHPTPTEFTDKHTPLIPSPAKPQKKRTKEERDLLIAQMLHERKERQGAVPGKEKQGPAPEQKAPQSAAKSNRSVRKAMRAPPPASDPAFAEWVMDAADRHTRNGELSVNELRTFLPDHPFTSWLTKQGGGQLLRFDTDRDGGISLPELRVACAQFAKHLQAKEATKPGPSSTRPSSAARTTKLRQPASSSRNVRAASAPRNRPGAKAAAQSPRPTGAAKAAAKGKPAAKGQQKVEGSRGEVEEFSFMKREVKRKYARSKKELQDAEKQKQEKECTFKPRINPLPPEHDTRHAVPRGQQRIEQLAKDKTHEYARREKAKHDREVAEEQEARAARPSTARSRHTTPRKYSPDRENMKWSRRDYDYDETDLLDRLHHEADNKVAVREKAKRAMEEAQLAEWSFTPRINQASQQLVERDPNYRPIHERVVELQRKKKESLHQLRIDHEQADANLTFKPALNEASRALMEQKGSRNSGDVTARLMQQNQEMVKRKHQMEAEHQRKLSQEHTFEPAINPNTEKILAQNKMFQAPFLQRQQAYADASKQKKQQAAQHEGEDCTFQPNIGNANQVLKEMGHHTIGETFLERIERMAHVDAERKKAQQQQAEHQFYSQFTFEPRTNRKPVQGREGSVYEALYKNEAGTRAKQQLVDAAEEKFEMEHTFHPDVELGYNRKQYPEGQLDKWQLKLSEPDQISLKIEQQRAEREQKIEESRRHREFEELKECTFQPNVCKKWRPKEESEPIIVRGLGRHLELREMAKRQEEEAAQREAEVFKLQPSPNVSGYTVPEPFKLSGTAPDARREKRRERVRKEAWEAEMGECTFQPNTKNMSNRELINQILNDDSYP